jgi:taurine dioxygenase
MTPYQRLAVRPIAGALGAELDGVDIAAGPDAQTIAEVRRALLDHSVVFLRDQRATPAQLSAFAARFGTPYLHPYARGLEAHPEVMPVVREPDDTGRTFGGSWHTDLTFLDAPTMGAVLYAVEVPPVGGDTLFASQYAAYETLSEGLRALLDDLDAVHSASVAFGKTTVAGARAMQLKTVEAAQEVVHPAVRVHPETGRRCLFVNQLNTRRFDGWSEAESAPLLDFLFDHSVRPEFTCRFRWSAGAVAFWDNRCVQHLAINDYAGHRREMMRVTLCGDRPFGVRAPRPAA